MNVHMVCNRVSLEEDLASNKLSLEPQYTYVFLQVPEVEGRQ